MAEKKPREDSSLTSTGSTGGFDDDGIRTVSGDNSSTEDHKTAGQVAGSIGGSVGAIGGGEASEYVQNVNTDSDFFEAGKTISDPLDLFGEKGKDAAKRAASAQLSATELGVAEQRQAREQARADLEPFRRTGAETVGGLSNLITNQSAQKDFVTKNDFFKYLTDESQSRLLGNQAVGGGTAGTNEALNESLLAMGTELISKNVNQRFNIAALGANAASGQATATLETGRTISDLTTQGGNAQAAGIVGAQNAQTQSRQQAASLGVGIAAIFASDRRIKENIVEIGKLNNGLPIYMFNYIDDPKLVMSVIAQDVQEVAPERVIEIDGILHVNMETVANAY